MGEPNTEDALASLEEISERARAMNLGLVAYLVEDVEAVCQALRAVRRTKLTAIPGAQDDR